MTNPTEAHLTDLQEQLANISDNIVFAQYFTFVGLMMSLPMWLGGPTWPWRLTAALCLLLSLAAAIQWWRLGQRKAELLRRGVKEPDFGKPPELEAIDRIMRPGGE
jgi:uncharacterized membrane protein YqjE